MEDGIGTNKKRLMEALKRIRETREKRDFTLEESRMRLNLK